MRYQDTKLISDNGATKLLSPKKLNYQLDLMIRLILTEIRSPLNPRTVKHPPLSVITIVKKMPKDDQCEIWPKLAIIWTLQRYRAIKAGDDNELVLLYKIFKKFPRTVKKNINEVIRSRKYNLL